MGRPPRYVKDPGVEVLTTSQAKRDVGRPHYVGHNSSTFLDKAVRRLLFKILLGPALVLTAFIALLTLMVIVSNLG